MQGFASPSANPQAGKFLRISLWTAQVLIFAAFILFGLQKLFMPAEALTAMWQTPWPVEYPGLLRFTGLIDAAGGIGILLPALTRIQPRLTILAALGCALLQISAIIFHSTRGEFAALPLNFILLTFVSFILWGRRKRAPILPRM
ncbi:DoxX family protein [Mesorhizobium camelthorni]|uniref:DoxX family protein n=1 Tax=Allomesorhizobium camelthorni TaxID=475069 RepID=A0A6G4WIR4_9HYPH|nr:DoxX family protein [Mesorhizobium camelthorni]NGO54248.1 DoxX family protein [Mesorhizobium camelthorni]